MGSRFIVPFSLIILSMIISFYALNVYAVPPDPRVYGNGFQGSSFISQQIPQITEAPAMRSPGVSLGTLKILVVLVEFQDVRHDVERDFSYFYNLISVYIVCGDNSY